jgi:hypothetical protein
LLCCLYNFSEETGTAALPFKAAEVHRGLAEDRRSIRWRFCQFCSLRPRARSVAAAVMPIPAAPQAGVVFLSGTFYWITETLTIYGGLSFPLAVGVGALFVLTFALYCCSPWRCISQSGSSERAACSLLRRSG